MKKWFLLCIVAMSSMGLLQASSNPTLSRVYGNQFTAEISPSQLPATVGTLDTTFGTGGSVNVSSGYTNGEGQARAIATIPNGDFIVAISSVPSPNANGTCVTYTAQGKLQTSFASAISTNSMIIDTYGDIIFDGSTQILGGYAQLFSPVGHFGQAFDGSTVFAFYGNIAPFNNGDMVMVGMGISGGVPSYAIIGTFVLSTASGNVKLWGITGNVDSLGNALPTVTIGLSSLVVDANNNIYVAFVNTYTNSSWVANTAYIARFAPTFNAGSVAINLDTTWNSPHGFVALPALNSATSALSIAKNNDGNLIVGGQVGANVVVTGVTPTGGALSWSSPSTFNTSVISSDTFQISQLLTTSDDGIFIIGSDTTIPKMAVIKLVGSTGRLDTTFNAVTSTNPNGTPGYNLFNIPTAALAVSTLTGAAVTRTGQIYVCGYQIASGVTTSYVSRLNNISYVTPVPQFPGYTNQGVLDFSFGTPATEAYAGVTTPINGLYGPLLQQRANTAIEMTVSGTAIPQGDIIVGMNGLTNTSAHSNMMLAFLNQEGAVDTTVNAYNAITNPTGTNGYLILANASSSNEYMTAMLQDGLGNLYISGYTSTSSTPTPPGNSANTSAFVRAYYTSSSLSGTAAWAASQTTAGWQGVGISLQNNRTLLCVAESATVGHITSYLGGTYAVPGTLDTRFGQYTGSPGSLQTGTIPSSSSSYPGLNMGPCYSLAVSTIGGYIYAAYKNSSTNTIDIAAFKQNGSGLVSGFGSSGIVSNIFPGYTIASNNVRIAFSSGGDLIVAAVGGNDGQSLFVGLYASLADIYYTPGSMIYQKLNTILTAANSLQLVNLTSVQLFPTALGGRALLTIWDSATTDTMYIASYYADFNGVTLDPAFNSMCVGGPYSGNNMQGVLPFQIGATYPVNGTIGTAIYPTQISTSALVQSTTGTNKGNIVMVGYGSTTPATDATPFALRAYGYPSSTEILDYSLIDNTPGVLEAVYNLDSSPVISAGVGNVIFTYPSITYLTTAVNTGKLLIGIDNGTTSIIARVYESTMALDTISSGTNVPFNGSTGYVTLAGSLRGINTISIDAYNPNNPSTTPPHNILIGGASGGSGWAQLINNAGTSSTSFNMPSNIASVNQIMQQQSGRYIVAGTEKTTGKGILVAFQDTLVSPATSFAVDTTFNPLGVGGALAGSYYVGSTDGLYAMAINTTYNASPLCNIDTIVVAYKNSSNSSVMLSVITADGSGIATSFNSGSALTTGIICDSSAAIRLNIDLLLIHTSPNVYASQNIIVGASYNNSGTSTNQVQIERYDAAGGTSTAFNGIAVVSGVQTIAFTGSSSVTLTGLMETTTQETVLTGYNTPAGSPAANGPLFAGRLDSTGALDVAWNAQAIMPDNPGLLTYGSGTSPAGIDINGSSIALNGTILSIGATSATTVPIVTLVQGDTNIAQVQQDPLQATCGTLDLTIPGAPTGSLALAGLVTGIPQKIYIYNSVVNSSPNGAMLIASTSGASVYLTQLNQDLSLNTNFATGTSNKVTLTPNSGTSPTSVTVTDMYVATGNIVTAQQYIYMCGYTTHSATNTPFIVQINPNGSGSPVYAPLPSGWTVTGGIRQSSNGRVLVCGYNALTTTGAIVAYNPTMTAIDTTFGNGTGYYTTGVTNPISAMTTDQYDRIYIAYTNAAGSAVNVQCVLENGTGISAFNTSFGGSYPTGVTNQIRMAIDLTNNMLVVAVQFGTSANNYIQVCRYNYATGGGAGTATPYPNTAHVINIFDLFIDSNQNMYVVGNDASSNRALVARIASTNATTIVIDTTYASPGGASLSNVPGVDVIAIGSLGIITAGMLDPDGRVYLVGSNTASTLGYMGRIFNNQWYTELSPAISQGVVGTLDLTLDAMNTGGIDLSVATTTSAAWHTVLSTTSKAQAIVENNSGDGSSFIAFVVSGNLIVGKLNADMVPVTAFGTNGLTTTSIAMSAVNSITQDTSGNIIVSGTNSSLQKVVLFNSSGVFQATLTNSLSATIGTTIVQQKSGRFIVGGYTGSNLLVSAYKNASAIVSPGSLGTLALDQTFGPAGSNGYYQGSATTQVDDIVIDSNDYIYIVYRDGSSTVNVLKLTPEGSFPTSINTPSGQLWSTNPMTVMTSATQPARIAINGAGNILIGASTSNNSNDVEVALYNASTGVVIQAAYSLYATNSPVLTKLVGSVASTNEFYGAMYTTAPAAIVYAITSAGTPDTAGFNVYNAVTNPSGTAGYLSTNVVSVTQVHGLAVQSDGKVVMVGYNNLNDPILIRAYGYPYVSQYAQAPDQVGAGQLDTTLWPTTGAYVLDNTTNGTFNSLVANYAVQRVYEYGNGIMTFVADSGSNTVIFQLLKDLTLNPAFNPSPGTPGYLALSTNYGGTTGLFVNSTGSNFIVGNSPGSPSTVWLQGVTTTGGSFSPTPLLVTGFMGTVQAVGQQNTGRIILAGLGTTTSGQQPNANGYLVGLTPAGIPDIHFGTPGSGSGNADMGSAHAITGMAIDPYNNIITVANNGGTPGTVILQKVTLAGIPTNISSAGTAISTATTNSNIKVVLDTTNNIVVGAATATGFIVRSYINNSSGVGSASGTNNATAAVTITAGSGSTVLSNMYVTSDNTADPTKSCKIILIGYDSSSGNVIVARLISYGTGAAGAGTLALDTTFNTALTGLGTPVAGVLVTSLGSMNQFFDAIIHADDRIMIVGSESSSATPYMGRVFGDLYATFIPQAPNAGVPGTLDASFGSGTPTTGYYALSTLSSSLNNSRGAAILGLSTGGYYTVVDNGTNSLLMRNLVNGSLDTTYNSGSTNYTAGIAQSNAPTGTNSMMMNGSNQLVLVGTNGSGGWVQRYTNTTSGSTSGLKDPTFGSSGVVTVLPTVSGTTAATVAVEQTLGRLVVAGYDGQNGALFAYQSLSPNGTPGNPDTTFNSTGAHPGRFILTNSNAIYNIIADQYDRLIFAVLNSAGTGIDLYRLTPSGELDITFGTNGKVANVLVTSTGGLSPNNASSIRVALDSVGNIVIAAYTYAASTDYISIVAFDNGILTGSSTNGNIFTHSFSIINFAGSGHTGISLTGLLTTTDGDVLVLGNQTSSTSATSPTWVARFANTTSGGTYALDPLFNPAGLNGAGVSGGVIGIFEYTNTAVGTTTPFHVYKAMTINYQGELGIVGYEQTGGSAYTPALLQVFDDAYITAELQSPNSKPVGNNDVTLGVSPTVATTQGITFFGSSTGTAASGQVARAVALQDDNNIVVAIDGNAAAGSGNSDIMISMFDNDGLLNTSFNSSGTPGMATALTYYPTQYVKDMVILTTPSNVNKAILAGYATNTVTGVTGSLVLQYNLTTASIDTSFGGLNSNPSGVAFGDGYQAWVVGQQSTGRIIVGGLAQGGAGLLLGYTSNGKLDASFGKSGYQSTNTGGTGIYSHAIDSQNRIVIAYNNGSNAVNVARFLADGSALDGSFGSGGVVTTISGLQTGINNNFKVVIDGSGNVIVAAVTVNDSIPNSITVSNYGPSGSSSPTYTKILTYALIGGSSLSAYTIGRLLVDAQGNVIVVASDSHPTPNTILITRLTSTLNLDTTFNGSGYLLYEVDYVPSVSGNTQVVTDALIHPDGRIMVVGSEE